MKNNKNLKLFVSIVISVVICLAIVFFIELRERPENIVEKIESLEASNNWSYKANEIKIIAKSKTELLQLASKYKNKKKSRNKTVINLYCGLIYFYEDKPEAFQYLNEAYKNKNYLNDKEKIALLEVLSKIEIKNFNFFSSIFYLTENLEISKNCNSISKQFETYIKLGSCFHILEDYNNATKNLVLAEKLLPILKDSITNHKKVELNIEFSKNYRKINQLDLSLNYLNKSSNATKEDSIAILLEKAHVYLDKNNLDYTKKCLKKVLKTINQSNYTNKKNHLIELHEIESKINLKQNDILQAIKNLMKIIEISKSSNNYEKTLESAELALNYTSNTDSNFKIIKNAIVESYEKMNNNRIKEQQYIQKLENLNYKEQEIQNENRFTNFIKIILISIVLASLIFLIKGTIIRKQLKIINDKRIKLENINQEMNKISFKMALKNEQLEHNSKIIANEIKSSVKVVQENALEMMTTQEQIQNSSINQIFNESNKLNELIDFLLTSSIKSKENSLQPTLIDFDTILKEIKSSLQNSIDLLDPEFIFPKKHPEFMGYKLHIYQLLKNLIENSLKYSHANKRLLIKIELSKVNDSLHLIYEDNGIGIPLEKQSKIFEKYEQSRIEDAKKGTGIGLFICSEIIKIYNGSIKVESTPGDGSKFIIQMITLS